MSTPILDINGIKNLFRTGMDYANDKFRTPLYSKKNDFYQYQESLLEKTQDLQTVMNIIALSQNNDAWLSAFNAPKPVCDTCTLTLTPIQFGVGHQGWIFISGISGIYSFNLSFFRAEIAPPEVVTIDRSEAVRWSISGGFGEVGKSWYSIPSEWVYLKYNQPSDTTFSLIGSGTNITNITLASLTPMQFQIGLTYPDVENKTIHTISLIMVANAPPAPAGKGACLVCSNGLGSMYYSYTDMNVTLVADNTPMQTGKGWIDHQLIKEGVPDSLYMQALDTVINMLYKTGPGWLWYSIQDYESGIQYLLTHFFLNKTYQEDIKLGQNIPMELINVYKNGVAYFTPEEVSMASSDLKVKLVDFINVPSTGLNMPARYNITLPGGKEVVLSIAAPPNVYQTSWAPYETPAFLYDKNGNQIGIGLIEANYYFTNETLARRILPTIGVDPTSESDYNMVLGSLTTKQTFSQKLLAVFIVLLPLIILSVILLYIYRGQKDQRKLRTIMCIIVILFMVLIYYGINIRKRMY